MPVTIFIHGPGIYMEAFHARREFKMEYRLRRADGEYRWLDDHGVPRFMPDGSFLGFIGSCLDITERKRAEAVAGLLVASLATRLAREAGRENDLVLETLEFPTHCGNCLDRIVGEVYSNACKFSPPGSKVEVKMTKADGHLTLSCRDHGCGMSEEEIAAIGPFKQFHRDEREQQGLGLGLAICKAQIKCAGCHLAFKPAGPGLVVELSLPEQ